MLKVLLKEYLQHAYLQIHDKSSIIMLIVEHLLKIIILNINIFVLLHEHHEDSSVYRFPLI